MVDVVIRETARSDGQTVVSELPRHAALEWWIENGQPTWVATARQFGVSEGTVRYWARMDSWKLTAAQNRLSAVPEEIRDLIGHEILETAILGAEYRRRVMEGTEEPDKLKIIIANQAIAEVGFVAPRESSGIDIGKHNQRGTARLTPTQLASMSPEELRAYEQGRSVPVSAEIIEVTPD